MERIPSDNHVRDMLDPVAPECFHALFSRAVKALEAGGGLAAFRRLGDHVLIAFDGTEYHRSTKLLAHDICSFASRLLSSTQSTPILPSSGSWRRSGAAKAVDADRLFARRQAECHGDEEAALEGADFDHIAADAERRLASDQVSANGGGEA
jgi:hypothetical protein